jgi:type VI secretion system protein ImpA
MIRAVDPSLLDLDRLAAPLTPETPCGEWLRYEGTYDRVRDARREDDSGLPQGVWQTDLKRADWAAVESLCATALVERSKDLQLAAWLLEAWIQLDSFAGAARGLELLHRLCAAYWEGMYPALGPEMEARLGPIRWINDKLSRRLRLLRLTQPDMTGVAPYSLADWEQAMRNPGGTLADAAMTLGKFEQSANLTPLPWLEPLAQDARATVAQVRAFDELIDEKTGALAPGLIRFRTEAESAMQLLDTLVDSARARQPRPQQQPEIPTPAHMPEAVASALVPLPPMPAPIALEAAPEPSGTGIRTRAQAYQLLNKIAEFLFENDPHSPTPYLIRRAVAWGNMQFDALLPELVRDPTGLTDVLQLLRLDEPDSQGQ